MPQVIASDGIAPETARSGLIGHASDGRPCARDEAEEGQDDQGLEVESEPLHASDDEAHFLRDGRVANVGRPAGEPQKLKRSSANWSWAWDLYADALGQTGGAAQTAQHMRQGRRRGSPKDPGDKRKASCVRWRHERWRL